MGLNQLNYEHQEALDILCEITVKRDRLLCWYNEQAVKALNKLYNDWKKICEGADSLHSNSFTKEAEFILADCISLQNRISEQTKLFENAVGDRLPAIKILAEDSQDIKSSVMTILNDWNENFKPQLLHLFEELEKFELKIRDFVRIHTN